MVVGVADGPVLGQHKRKAVTNKGEVEDVGMGIEWHR